MKINNKFIIVGEFLDQEQIDDLKLHILTYDTYLLEVNPYDIYVCKRRNIDSKTKYVIVDKFITEGENND